MPFPHQCLHPLYPCVHCSYTAFIVTWPRSLCQATYAHLCWVAETGANCSNSVPNAVRRPHEELRELWSTLPRPYSYPHAFWTPLGCSPIFLLLVLTIMASESPWYSLPFPFHSYPIPLPVPILQGTMWYNNDSAKVTDLAQIRFLWIFNEIMGVYITQLPP